MNVTVVGNLCADPEIRHTKTGQPVASFRIAENRYTRDAGGEWHTETAFYTAQCWRDLADHAAGTFQRGDRVVVVGRLRQDTWSTETGERRSRYVIDADDLAASVRYTPVAIDRTRPEAEPVEYADDDPRRPFESEEAS